MSSSSKVYTTDHSNSVLRTHKWRTVANSAAYLAPYLKPGMSILDIGCGPGSITVDLAKHVPQGQVIGIENVPDPLDQARAFAAEQGTTNVNFKVGDIHKLEYPDDSFDVVHVHQVLQHVADPVAALREMRRVAKPGGIVAARESSSWTWYPDSPGIEAWADLTMRMGKAKGGNPHPGNHIHSWAVQAGFERSRITCTAGSWCFSSPDEREYFGGSMAERILSSGFTKSAIDEGYSTSEELAAMSQAWREFVDNEEGWFGILHGEIICRK